jgi:predicted phosphodiesterase
MPKIAILSDIHSNLPALKAVLKEIAEMEVDQICFGGDTVGYAGEPDECVSLVREHGGVCVLGNHDFYTLSVRSDRENLPSSRIWKKNPVWAGVELAARTLGEDNAAWLGSLPGVLKIPGAVLSHSALHDFGDWPYLHSLTDARPTLAILRESGDEIGFFGHTHRQEIFYEPKDAILPERLDATRMHLPKGVVCTIIVGSVGQPRDHDLRAAWVLWDSETRIVEFRHTEYPALETAREILITGLPKESALRLLSTEEAKVLDL